MSTEIECPPEQSVASLVSGILGDARRLVEQQILLTRREFEDDLRRRAKAAAICGFGLGVLFLAAIALCLTLAGLLHWLGSPPGTDPAWLPLWACYAVVAAVLSVVGGILAFAGQARFRSGNPVQNPATEKLQESVR